MEEINQHTIDAVLLYRDAMKENHAELLVPLEDCAIIYIPNMINYHRTIYYRQEMILLYESEDIIDDYLSVSNARAVWFKGTTPNSKIVDHINAMICDNFQCTPYDANTILPYYIEIEPSLLIEISKLLMFL